jgi:phage-related baseplate assembly protein
MIDMALLTTKNYSTLVNDQVAAVQGAASSLLNFLVGSTLRAIAQANATVALWLQGLILQLLSVTRLATSLGTDVDSFLADFPAFGGRLQAIKAQGTLTYFRATTTVATVIPVGAVVASGDGTQLYTVIADPTNNAYVAASNGYPLASGVASVNVTIQAQVGGAAANMSAGGISIMQTGIAGVDGVTNPSNFTNGVNAETDAAVKTRFQLYFASLSNASVSAIGYAIRSLNQNFQYTITLQPSGSPQVVISVDDGSGAIPTASVNLIAAAVNNIIAAGIFVGVTACTALSASVNMTIVTASGFVHATVAGQVALALIAYINGVGLGNPVSYAQLFAVACAVPGVTDATDVTLNGGVVDLVPTASQTYKAGSVSVS